MKAALKRIFTKEYFLFMAIGFLPLIYKIIQTFFLNSFENAIKILGQIAFLEIIFKIFQETFFNPLFKILGKHCNTEENKNYQAKKLLIFYSIACFVFTLAIFLLIEPIMYVSKIPVEIFDSTKLFLQIITFANGVNVIVQYLFTFNIISKNSKGIFVYFLISSLATLVLDIILIPKFAFGLGIYGMAISTLVVAVAQLIYFLITMPKVDKRYKQNFDKKQYAKLCAISFIETLTRNLTYYFIVLVLLNTLNNQDLYYISNDFIWSIMLVPVLAQNTCIKQEVSTDAKKSLSDYFINSIFIILFMCVMIGVAYVIFRYVYRFENYMEYFLTLLKLMPCYLIFIFDNVVESYYIAVGNLFHVFVQTFITNILVYLTSFVLYVTGVWNVTLNGIIVVFSLGMIISSAYTISSYIYLKHKQKESNKSILE